MTTPTCCHFSIQNSGSGTAWRPEDIARPTPATPNAGDIYRPDILDHIEATITELDEELRKLSLDIHDHPELAFKEYHAHDVLTSFMHKQGFDVTKHFHLETAWRAAFSHGEGGRSIGVNSEMDALPAVGHACGHNLIAIGGVAVACAIKAAIQKFDIPATVILLGTPAEEGGGGKLSLLDAGAYKEMDACLMCHPAPGPIGSVSLSSSLAIQSIIVEYSGHTAHAALSPWEGKNALDAAVLAYNGISVLRQQLRPEDRVHAIIESKDWAVNIIPDYARIICLVRSPTRSGLGLAVKRVLPCFHASALASGCEIKIALGLPFDNLCQNTALGDEVANVVLNRYGAIDYEWGIHSASTDFGNVTYALPSLHPGFAIPTVAGGGNHTREFAKSATTIEAHYACLDVSKALAASGMRVLTDEVFLARVKKDFEKNLVQGDGSIQVR